jgi:hypothetical protein
LAIVLLVLVVVVVSVSVDASKNGGGNENKMTPTVAETTAPVATDNPAASPHKATPTVAETSAPVATDNPTASPRAPCSPVVDKFLNGLPPYSKELTESDPHSPQAKALAWLRSDPLYYQYLDVFRLNQRCALAVL